MDESVAAAAGSSNGYRQSGVQSEAPREKGDWDELFLSCAKKSLTEEGSQAHKRNVSTATI